MDCCPRLTRSAHLLLTAAVTFWTAGFDIIYSCQDYEFDSELQLYSVPRSSASETPS